MLPHPRPIFPPPALRRVEELFRQRGTTVIANDTFVNLGLYLLGVGMAVFYVAALSLALVIFTDFSFRDVGGGVGDMGLLKILLVVGLFLTVPAVVILTILQVVRSSQKAIFVCLVQVIRRSSTQEPQMFVP